MPLQQIRVTPASRKCTNEKDKAKPQSEETFVSARMERRHSSQPSTVSGGTDICRICHCEGEADLPLISPCYCSGSLRYVHQSCLQQWIKSSDTRCCELCKFHFIMHTKIKPFRKWEKLEMAPGEQRKILCSIIFHAVAIACVIWSLYVLIQQTAEEMRSGLMDWPFWTKLIVMAIGSMGGLVFMYVLCKMCVQLFRMWRDYNRIILVQSAPDKGTEVEKTEPTKSDEEIQRCQSGTSSEGDPTSNSKKITFREVIVSDVQLMTSP